MCLLILFGTAAAGVPDNIGTQGEMKTTTSEQSIIELCHWPGWWSVISSHLTTTIVNNKLPYILNWDPSHLSQLSLLPSMDINNNNNLPVITAHLFNSLTRSSWQPEMTNIRTITNSSIVYFQWATYRWVWTHNDIGKPYNWGADTDRLFPALTRKQVDVQMTVKHSKYLTKLSTAGATLTSNEITTFTGNKCDILFLTKYESM